MRVSDALFCYDAQQILQGECDTVLLLQYKAAPPSVVKMVLMVLIAETTVWKLGTARPGRACTFHTSDFYPLVSHLRRNLRSKS
ncbi:MAG: hypothetical protein MUC47_02095 [Candidatus Kapabacteria bacterium]|nr:hypothetical protein [Candidatus Kapabacteria bacterium]